jgi:hypothetical protein
MSGAPVLGLPGINLHSGDHVCAFYRDEEERDELLLPFLREGVRAGQKCLCVVESVSPDIVRDALGHDANAVREGTLDVLTPSESYLRGGVFSMPAMLEFWQQRVDTALTGGTYDFVRVVGEMPRALTDRRDHDAFLLYESELNRFAALRPQVIVCLYDLRRFGGAVLIDILRTHPLIMLGGAVLENPYYLQPDEFLSTRNISAA